ncbi:hypothetical protein F5B19DRAFT_496422 [Rostrohypoxylon terebratum]|nr:hypothetical protein F5B19DRAFT_496422 [Rostrohypoxylon terebratum]
MGHYKSECRSSGNQQPRQGGIPQPEKKQIAEAQISEEKEINTIFTVAASRATQTDPPIHECPTCQGEDIRACRYHPGHPRSVLAIMKGCTCHENNPVKCSEHPGYLEGLTPSEADQFEKLAQKYDEEILKQGIEINPDVTREEIEAVMKIKAEEDELEGLTARMKEYLRKTSKAKEAEDIPNKREWKVETRSQDNHETQHWTFCTDDWCGTHRNAKMDSGYWPQPKKKEEEASEGDEPTEENECICEEEPQWPEWPRSCYLHPNSARSQEAIKQGCMCYSSIVCDVHEALEIGLEPDDTKFGRHDSSSKTDPFYGKEEIWKRYDQLRALCGERYWPQFYLSKHGDIDLASITNYEEFGNYSALHQKVRTIQEPELRREKERLLTELRNQTAKFIMKTRPKGMEDTKRNQVP